MKVRFIGFSFEAKSIISIKELVSYLVGIRNEQYLLGEHNRMIFINQNQDQEYFLGVLVTIKDQRRFCELANENGSFKIKVNDLEENNNIMDFNFFVINKNTGFGLYQHYHQSCSINQFGYLISKRYLSLIDLRIDSEIKAIKNISESQERVIKKKYSGRLALEVLVRKDKLNDILNELERIKSFEFDFLYLEAKEKEYEPLSPYVKKERRRFSFVKNSPVSILSSQITKYIENNGLMKGKIIGEDDHGVERIIHILDNPDNYGEYDYDEVAVKLDSLILDNFENSWVTEELLKCCRKHKHIFEAKTK